MCGKTLGCGTGACAAAIVCYLNKEVDRNIKVELDGGILNVGLNDKLENIILSGDANFVYEGRIDL